MIVLVRQFGQQTPYKQNVLLKLNTVKVYCISAYILLLQIICHCFIMLILSILLNWQVSTPSQVLLCLSYPC